MCMYVQCLSVYVCPGVFKVMCVIELRSECLLIMELA